MADKRCYTVKEIQEMLGVSRVTVYELLKRGELHYVIVGGKYLVLLMSLSSGTILKR